MSKFSMRSFHFPGDGVEILWGEKILKVQKNHEKFPLGGLFKWSNLKSRKKSQTNPPVPLPHWWDFWSALAVHCYHIFSPSSFSPLGSTETNEQNWMSSEFSFAEKSVLERCLLINWFFWKINSQIYRTNQVGNFASVSYIVWWAGVYYLVAFKVMEDST